MAADFAGESRFFVSVPTVFESRGSFTDFTAADCEVPELFMVFVAACSFYGDARVLCFLFVALHFDSCLH